MPMYLIWIVMAAVLLVGIILFLHKSQQQNRREVAERSAPLAGLEGDFRVGSPAPVAVPPPRQPVPAREAVIAMPAPDNPSPAATDDDIPVMAASNAGNHWLNQVKRLREKGDSDAALALCEQYYPRVQAFQQAALILRQQIRERVEQHRPANDCIRQLYRVAALADLYRSNNPLRPRDPQAAWNTVAGQDFDYQRLGTRELRLLTKSDIRHLEQLWGRPVAHLHAEEVLGEQWQLLCR